MKKLALALTLFAFALVPLSAQSGKYGATPEDSIECVKYLSFYKEYYKGNNIKEAIPSWRGALKGCPKGVSQALYQDGQTILKYLIARESNPARKNELVDSLLMMYDLRVSEFPTSKTRLSALTFKMYDLVKFRSTDNQAIYKGAMDAIDFGQEATDEAMYLFAFQSALNLQKEGALTVPEIMDLYTRLSGLFEQKKGTLTEAKLEKLKDTQSKFETLFAGSGLADCENLLAVFGPTFEEKSNDITHVKRVVQLLSNAGCEKSDLFLTAVEKMDALEPSGASAYYLYKLYNAKGESTQAMAFLQKAIDSEDTPAETDAAYLLEMGTYYYKELNQSMKALEIARQALQMHESVAGKANLLMGHIWSLAKPQGSEIDTHANFWVAVDYFTKAKAADESLKEECDRLIATYRQYFPTVEDAFMHDLSDGKAYTVKWNGISANTTVRTRK